MKAGLTRSAIDAFAEALNSESAADSAARLKALSAIFSGMATRPMLELLELLDRVAPAQDQVAENPTGAPVATVIPSLLNLEAILSKTSTRGRLEDLVAFRRRLQTHESASIRSVVSAVQVLRRGRGDEGLMTPDETERLAQRLKAALGHDDQFNPLFDQLSKLDAAGVSGVARALMSSGTSKSRKRDLERIRGRHESQRTLVAKQRAMAGRTAA
jgi:hypothetical protein